MSIEQRMSNEELTALAGLTFNWTRALDDVWTDQRYHVDGLHAVTAALIGSGIRTVTADGARPLGIVIQGQRGVGKTHLLGWTREQVQRAGGFFFLVGDLFTKAFWEQVLGSMVEQLLPLPDGSRNQLAALQEDQHVGYYYLTANEVDLQDRRHWRINSTRKIPRLLVNEVSQLLALAGPIVLAIDQVDALIDELVGRSADDAAKSRPLADVATGLMALRDVAHRTLTIVSCLPESWEYIRKYGVDTVTDRFREARQLRNIPSADVGRLMIEKRFAVDFGRVGFEPPYPTWPILPAAFDDASKYTARALLKRIEAHVARCLQNQVVAELDHLDELPAGPQPVFADSAAESPGLTILDRLFARLARDANVSAALDPEAEDAAMPPLLAAGLEAWARELGGADDQAFVQEPLPGKNPRLHACLRMLLDRRTERQRRWAFRAIASHSPRAVQTRLKKAIEGAGLAAGGVGDAGRRLFVLRSAGWPSGPVTERAAAEFAAKGGVLLPVAEADLATFAALAELLAGHHPELNAWLLARRPAHATDLLARALGTVDPHPDPHPDQQPDPQPDPHPDPQPDPHPDSHLD